MVDERQIRTQLESEARDCYEWSNGPAYEYAAHTHGYEKVLYCIRGSITFLLPEEGREIRLRAGDRMVLPRGTLHSATVGSDGVTCLEGKR